MKSFILYKELYIKFAILHRCRLMHVICALLHETSFKRSPSYGASAKTVLLLWRKKQFKMLHVLTIRQYTNYNIISLHKLKKKIN